ncbi:hypothetical protein Pelo_15407 [Pelomyxa schiedti]|nr:hypothetical protein Pelo_15407 [Pelomyxa schiedti]
MFPSSSSSTRTVATKAAHVHTHVHRNTVGLPPIVEPSSVLLAPPVLSKHKKALSADERAEAGESKDVLLKNLRERREARLKALAEKKERNKAAAARKRAEAEERARLEQLELEEKEAEMRRKEEEEQRANEEARQRMVEDVANAKRTRDEQLQKEEQERLARIEQEKVAIMLATTKVWKEEHRKKKELLKKREGKNELRGSGDGDSVEGVPERDPGSSSVSPTLTAISSPTTTATATPTTRARNSAHSGRSVSLSPAPFRSPSQTNSVFSTLLPGTFNAAALSQKSAASSIEIPIDVPPPDIYVPPPSDIPPPTLPPETDVPPPQLDVPPPKDFPPPYVPPPVDVPPPSLPPEILPPNLDIPPPVRQELSSPVIGPPPITPTSSPVATRIPPPAPFAPPLSPIPESLSEVKNHRSENLLPATSLTIHIPAQRPRSLSPSAFSEVPPKFIPPPAAHTPLSSPAPSIVSPAHLDPNIAIPPPPILPDDLGITIPPPPSPTQPGDLAIPPPPLDPIPPIEPPALDTTIPPPLNDLPSPIPPPFDIPPPSLLSPIPSGPPSPSTPKGLSPPTQETRRRSRSAASPVLPQKVIEPPVEKPPEQRSPREEGKTHRHHRRLLSGDFRSENQPKPTSEVSPRPNPDNDMRAILEAAEKAPAQTQSTSTLAVPETPERMRRRDSSADRREHSIDRRDHSVDRTHLEVPPPSDKIYLGVPSSPDRVHLEVPLKESSSRETSNDRRQNESSGHRRRSSSAAPAVRGRDNLPTERQPNKTGEAPPEVTVSRGRKHKKEDDPVPVLNLPPSDTSYPMASLSPSASLSPKKHKHHRHFGTNSQQLDTPPDQILNPVSGQPREELGSSKTQSKSKTIVTNPITDIHKKLKHKDDLYIDADFEAELQELQSAEQNYKTANTPKHKE